MKRFQMWSSLSLGFVIAMAIVAGCTRSISVSPTVPPLVLTLTPTITYTPAVTPTATSETVQVGPGASSPGSSTQIPGATNIPVLEINASNSGTSNATITSITLTASGTGNDLSGVASVLLYIDNGNGVYDAGDVAVTGGTFSSDDGTLTLNLSSNNLVPPSGSGSLNYFVVYNFSGSANGSFSANLTGLAGTDGTTGSPILLSGAPVNGATINVVGATSTATNSPTNSPTNTATLSPTNSPSNTPVPGANTNTATNTPTNSPTKTGTNTPTLTFTSTPTPSPTKSPTNTPTPTITNTPPPGSTATNSPTETPTTTPTNTPPACPLPVSASYTFDTDINCWDTDATIPGSTVQWTNSAPAGSTSGGGALQGNVTYPSGQNNEDFEVQLPANTDLTNKILTFKIYVPSSFAGTYGGVQPYIKTGSGYAFCNASWIPYSFDSWQTVSIDLSSAPCNTSTSDVRTFGIQIFIGGMPSSAAGHIYIDDVTVTNSVAGATPTPTPTATPLCDASFQPTYTFDTCTQGWVLDGSIAGEVVSQTTSTFHTGPGAWTATIPFDATHTSEEAAFMPPFDTTNLTGATIGAWVYSTVGGYTQVFVNSNNWAAYESTGWVTLPASTWTYVTFTPAWTGGGDSTKVDKFGVSFDNMTTAATVYVDDVTITYGSPSTPTPTPTSGGCPLPLSSDYTFDSAIDCWTTANNFATSTTQWNGAPPAGSTSGGGAFQANVTYPAGQNNEDFETTLPANTDLTGKILTFNVWVDPVFGGSYGGMQIYIKTGVGSTFCNGPSGDWQNIPSFGAWHTYSFNVDATCPAGEADVRAIGIQVFVGGVTVPAAGHVYIDDVTVTTALPPTNTPTPTGLGWTYEDATAQNWNAVASSGIATSAVTGYGNGSSYGLAISLPAGALTNANNDFRAEVTSGPVIGAGQDWSALGLTSVSVDYYFGTSLPSYASTLYPYVIAGSGPTTYGGTYNGWPGQCNGTCAYVSNGAWHTVLFTPSGPNWATDMTNVIGVGVDINVSTNPTFAGVDYVIDNITLQ